MDWVDIGNMLIAAVAGGASVVAARLYGTRRAELRVSFEHVPVGGDALPDDHVSVALNGQMLEAPFLVTLSLTSTGGSDISSSHFDALKPLQIHFYGPPALAPVRVLAITHQDGIRVELGDETSAVAIPPQLLKARRRGVASVLVDGEPRAIEVGDLVGVNIVVRGHRASVASARLVPGELRMHLAAWSGLVFWMAAVIWSLVAGNWVLATIIFFGGILFALWI
ncbi:hypothetical protein ACIG47_03190 [Promicromonospora sp. NPDC052451]|uniref:hypothetical protein n=1 Tax=Promicromonospora sp. NPDC052451 TaxID=3364407 RepID=UPI0037C55E20